MLSDGGKRLMKAEDRNARVWRFRCTNKILKRSERNPNQSPMARKPRSTAMLKPRLHALLLKCWDLLWRSATRKNRTMKRWRPHRRAWHLFACSLAAVIFAKSFRHSNIARMRHKRTLTSQKKEKGTLFHWPHILDLRAVASKPWSTFDYRAALTYIFRMLHTSHAHTKISNKEPMNHGTTPVPQPHRKQSFTLWSQSTRIVLPIVKC